MVSRNIYNKKGRLKWCVREEPVKDADNGWRILSDIDTEDFLADKSNWCILVFESLVEIEPAVLAVYELPVGTEVTLVHDGIKKYFVDTNTGAIIY